MPVKNHSRIPDNYLREIFPDNQVKSHSDGSVKIHTKQIEHSQMMNLMNFRAAENLEINIKRSGAGLSIILK